MNTGASICSDVSCTGVGVDENPTCSVSPTNLNFGSVDISGGYADRTFTITNTGTGTLTGDPSESCSHYSIVSGGDPYSLGAGQSRTVTVRFDPSSTGTKTCTVNTGASICSDVSCTGVGVDNDPVCSVNPTSLDFGDVTVGLYLDKVFTIQNTGGGTLTGAPSENCGHYDIVAGAGQYNLTAGQHKAVQVRFEPTSAGTHTCTVNTGASICLDVSCTGNGIEPPPACTVDPTSLNFGSVNVSGGYADRAFTITNTGGGTLTGDPSEGCSHYSIISGGDPYSLGAGQSRTVTVRFDPSSTGTKTCTVNTGASICSDVSCTGVGFEEPDCSVSPTSLNFGSVDVSGGYVDKTFTITNTGGGTLTGDPSESCSDYSIVSGGDPYSLGAGQSRTVTVRFNPSSTGTKTCTVNTGASICSDVSCTGVGFETETAELHLWVAGTSWYGDTNVPGWVPGDMWMKWSDAGSHPIHDPSWNDCPNNIQDMATGPINEYLSFYITEVIVGDYGLDIDSSCTSISVEVEYDIEPPLIGSYGNIWTSTDAAGCPMYEYPYSTSCTTGSRTIPSQYVYTTGRIEINVGYHDEDSLGDNDAGVKEFTYTFNGWMVPSRSESERETGEIRVLLDTPED